MFSVGPVQKKFYLLMKMLKHVKITLSDIKGGMAYGKLRN